MTLETEISQAMVYGDDKPYLVAVVWPDEDFMREFARDNGLSNDIEVLGKNEEFRKVIRTAIDHVNQRLSTIEKVRSFMFAEAAFTIDNEMLTPSMKIRRHKIREAYAKQLDGLYQRKRSGQ